VIFSESLLAHRAQESAMPSTTIATSSNNNRSNSPSESELSAVKAKFFQYAQEGKRHKLKTLLKHEGKNIDINELDASGETALYKATRSERRDTVELLLENSADPNKRNIDGQTAVHACAFTCNIEIMAMLIKYGGDLRLHDAHNKNPKHYALDQPGSIIRRRMLGLIEDIRKLACVNLNLIKQTEDRYNLNIQPKAINDKVNPCVAGFGILFKTAKEMGVTTILPTIMESDLASDENEKKIKNGAFMNYHNAKEEHVPGDGEEAERGGAEERPDRPDDQ